MRNELQKNKHLKLRWYIFPCTIFLFLGHIYEPQTPALKNSRSFHCTLIPIQTCLFHQLPSINHVRDLLVLLTWNILYRVTKYEKWNFETKSWFFSFDWPFRLSCSKSTLPKYTMCIVQWYRYNFWEEQTMYQKITFRICTPCTKHVSLRGTTSYYMEDMSRILHRCIPHSYKYT